MDERCEYLIPDPNNLRFRVWVLAALLRLLQRSKNPRWDNSPANQDASSAPRTLSNHSNLARQVKVLTHVATLLSRGSAEVAGGEDQVVAVTATELDKGNSLTVVTDSEIVITRNLTAAVGVSSKDETFDVTPSMVPVASTNSELSFVDYTKESLRLTLLAAQTYPSPIFSANLIAALRFIAIQNCRRMVAKGNQLLKRYFKPRPKVDLIGLYYNAPETQESRFCNKTSKFSDVTQIRKLKPLEGRCSRDRDGVRDIWVHRPLDPVLVMLATCTPVEVGFRKQRYASLILLYARRSSSSNQLQDSGRFPGPSGLKPCTIS
ncbi:hypothetical protein EIP91_005778 [Steccherinum ochraceum]|uniref:Uncharacterized protein n=1 Tax=Steccherinum ochraceum TaxID=92696 RepID=A0A4V2MVN3_9APHY|nr:hypothetical protein EIP91_005778 [Steccherinum ochraceum]